MFTDISVSQIYRRILNYSKKNHKVSLDCDFNVLVLTSGAWPLTLPTTDFNTPAELLLCESHFQSFYTEQFNGRKLHWLHQQSKGELKSRAFPSNKVQGYTFQCSTYQMGILLLFNENSKLTYTDIRETTQLTDEVLKSTLKTLLKVRILLCDPKLTPEAPNLTEKHRFAVNPNFKRCELLHLYFFNFSFVLTFVNF